MIINFILLLNFFLYNYCFCQMYDPNQALINVWLSGAAYCDKSTYNKMILAGPATGFIYKKTLYDLKTDLQGYTGIIPSQKIIYVAYRGTSSISNWMSDLEVKQVPYKSYPECNCKIHYGFYLSALNVKNQTLESVTILRKENPNYNLIITGHSYGAAVSQIISMELLKEGIKSEIYNYGQPRIGDKKYADFVNTKLNHYWRFTHNKDIVPHLPPIEGFSYYHSCREVFENIDGKLQMCSDFLCEDPKCADQYSTSQTIVDDHYYYLNHRVQCNESTVTQVKSLFNIIFSTANK